MANGRATFPKEKGQAIPEPLKIVAEVQMPLKGQTWVIVEGERLPAWQPGMDPWHFNSLAELLDFIAGPGQ